MKEPVVDKLWWKSRFLQKEVDGLGYLAECEGKDFRAVHVEVIEGAAVTGRISVFLGCFW